MRLSCLARNGRSPGEESLTAAIAAQAIEAQPAFGQIKPMRGQVLACAEQHFGDVPASDRPTQEAPRSRRSKEKPWRAERVAHLSPRRQNANAGAATHRIVVGRRDCPAQSKCEWHRDIAVMLTDWLFALDPNRETTDPWSHLPLVTAPIGDWAGPGATLPPGAGSVRIDMRAQAVHPTVMAPKMANTSRHQPGDTPNEQGRGSHRSRRVPQEAQIAAQ